MSTPPDRTKKEVLQDFLERGTTQIVLVPQHEGVKIPAEFQDELILRLNLSFRFASPDLKVDWWGVRQTLTFPTGRFLCQVPWDAIFAIADPRRPDSASVWPESMPPVYRLLHEQQNQSSPATSQAAPPRRSRVKQQVVDEQSARPARKTRGFTPRVIQGGAGHDPEDRSAAPESTLQDPDPDDPDTSPPTRPRGRPHLRIVK